MGRIRTCVNRFKPVAQSRGVWDRILSEVSKAYDGDIQMIDSSSIRVHQHAANGQKKRRDPVAWVARRGGLTTKIHALVDASRPAYPFGRSPKAKPMMGVSAHDMLGSVWAAATCSWATEL